VIEHIAQPIMLNLSLMLSPEMGAALFAAIPGLQALQGSPIVDPAVAQLTLQALQSAKTEDTGLRRAVAVKAASQAKETASRMESELDPLSVDMLLVMCRLSGGGICTASQARIAREAGCHKSSLQARLDDGRFHEWIIVRPRPGYRVTNETHFTEGTAEALAFIAQGRRREKRAGNGRRKPVDKSYRSVQKPPIPVQKPPKATPNNNPSLPRDCFHTEQHSKSVVPCEKEKRMTVPPMKVAEIEHSLPEVSLTETPESIFLGFLTDEGVTTKQASVIIKTFSRDRIARNLALSGREKATNPAGWLVQAIREDWAGETSLSHGGNPSFRGGKSVGGSVMRGSYAVQSVPIARVPAPTSPPISDAEERAESARQVLRIRAERERFERLDAEDRANGKGRYALKGGRLLPFRVLDRM
jgi:hypothetical protein